MKHSILFVILCLLILSIATCSLAENTGRSNGRGSSSMQTLNQGIAYLNGNGVEQDYQKALELFVTAHEAGNMKAARYIGMMYEQGLGVEQAYAEAEKYYNLGVQAGDLTSGYYLGLLYEQGLGVEQD